jgi:periplasmic protein TonB
MATTTKESVPTSVQADTPVDQSSPARTPRTDPLGVEIPVIVHASRYSAAGKGLNKGMPPVHEETRTVIVFSQGAFVRLTASLSIGETVVLTNKLTGADILCRVGSVKTQPGIQNYVDLEFTQRAPGFWNKPSNGDAGALNASAHAEAPAPVISHVPPPELDPMLPPSIKAVTPGPKPSPVDSLTIATVATQPEPELQPSISAVSAATPPVRLSSNVVSGASSGMRQSSLSQQGALGGALASTPEKSAASRKGLMAAVAILGVAGLAGGAYMLTQRSHSGPAGSEIAAAPSAPVQVSQPVQAEQSPAPLPAASASIVVNASPAPEEKPVVQAPPPARREPVLPAGKVVTLKAPIIKQPAISGSSEAPPTLVAQDNAATQDVLGSGILSGASRLEAPAAPAPAASAPVRVGGQLQMPKVISSPSPVYPEIARTQHFEGVVVMDALIDATGAVADVKYISGPLVFRQAAIDALKKWKYQPARLDGQPTSVHVNVSMNFASR